MLSQKHLKELFNYNQSTGIFTRLKTISGAGQKGSIVGTLGTIGYLSVCIKRKKYSLHRLAFLYVYGYMPENEVDHKNGKRDDNRFENLRHVTNICNSQNQKTSKNNKSGFNGVCLCKTTGKWYVQVELQGKNIFLGRYRNKIDAALARLTFETQCPRWKCNHRGELIRAIKRSWPNFNEKCVI